MKKKVFVGLSGGVDSAVTAYLLLKAGFDVTGVYMNYLPDKLSSSNFDHSRVIKICKQLEIPLEVYNLKKEFSDIVIQPFIKQYRDGITPNPCVLCNPLIKFGELMKKCLGNGADYFATGHYALNHTTLRLLNYNNVTSEKCEELLLPKDSKKDQTYFLYRLNQEQLARVIFPLGSLLKSEVRQIAKDIGLNMTADRESHDVCFIAKGQLLNLLTEGFPDGKRSLNVQCLSQGDFVDIDSQKVVGKHNGAMVFTVGQRKGIKIGGTPKPYYVVKKDLKTNTVYLAQGYSNPALWKKEVYITDCTLIDGGVIEQLDGVANLTGMIRYGTEKVPIKSIKTVAGKYKTSSVVIQFARKVFAVAPGQSLVLYCENKCVGGGIIFEV